MGRSGEPPRPVMVGFRQNETGRRVYDGQLADDLHVLTSEQNSGTETVMPQAGTRSPASVKGASRPHALRQGRVVRYSR